MTIIKLEPLERVKREAIILKLEKENFINFSEKSITILHELFDSFHENPDIIKILSKTETSKLIFQRAIELYQEN